MRFAIMRLTLFSALVIAQNGKWNVDPYSTPQTRREAAIEACFRDAPQTSARDAWLDHCLREAR